MTTVSNNLFGNLGGANRPGGTTPALGGNTQPAPPALTGNNSTTFSSPPGGSKAPLPSGAEAAFAQMAPNFFRKPSTGGNTSNNNGRPDLSTLNNAAASRAYGQGGSYSGRILGGGGSDRA